MRFIMEGRYDENRNPEDMVGLVQIFKDNRCRQNAIPIKVKTKNKEGKTVWINRFLKFIPLSVNMEDVYEDEHNQKSFIPKEDKEAIAQTRIEKFARTILFDDATLCNYYEPKLVNERDEFEEWFLLDCE